jgi:hypothetical protein
VFSLPTDSSEAQLAEVRHRAQSVLEELRLFRVPFALLARRYSDAPNAARGGAIANWETVPQAVSAAVERLAPGDFSGLVETPEALYIVELVERLPHRPVAAGAQPDYEANERLRHRSERIVELLARLRAEAEMIDRGTTPDGRRTSSRERPHAGMPDQSQGANNLSTVTGARLTPENLRSVLRPTGGRPMQ